MNFARALYRLTPVLFECSASLRPCNFAAASYSVKTQHRRPVKIYSSDGQTEIRDIESDGKPRIKSKSSDEIKGVIELNKNNSQNRAEKKAATYDVQDSENDSESDVEVIDELSGTRFFRLGDSDTTFERMVMKVQSKRQRDKSNIFMLEGKRLIQDAITAGVIPNSIFFSRKSLVEDLTMPPGVINLYKLPYSDIKKWSPLQTPPGIVAFCNIPNDSKLVRKQKRNVLPLTLICDNIREPGNLGTILRTFSGVGCSDILLTKGCTDIWDSKVLRGSAGAHFHVPMKNSLTWEEINARVGPNASVFIAHHNRSLSEFPEERSMLTVPYFSIDYSCLSEIVVLVGGETEGVSHEAIQFARYRDGMKINIPLDNDIDSLNVGAAVSAILFEIKRQFITNKSNVSSHDSESSDVKSIALGQ